MPDARPAAVDLIAKADGVLCDVVTADLKAGESRALLLDAPEGYTTLHARIVEKDALALDNERWYAAQGEGSYRVALAGENVFLEKALSLREDIVLLRTTAQEAVEIENIDLYVFDGELPETLPQSGAVLAVNPKAQVREIACGEAREADGEMRVSTQRAASSLTENLTLKQGSWQNAGFFSQGTPGSCGRGCGADAGRGYAAGGQRAGRSAHGGDRL